MVSAVSHGSVWCKDLMNAVQMRCWLRCINGVAVVENDGVEDGVEDAGAMEARSSGGYGNGDVPAW